MDKSFHLAAGKPNKNNLMVFFVLVWELVLDCNECSHMPLFSRSLMGQTLGAQDSKWRYYSDCTDCSLEKLFQVGKNYEE